MIEFRYDKEREILLRYASLLKNDTVTKLIESGQVDNGDDVVTVARFYWEMVDLTNKEDTERTGKYDDMEKWLERIYTSLHIYFNNIGYGDVWDDEIPE